MSNTFCQDLLAYQLLKGEDEEDNRQLHNQHHLHEILHMLLHGSECQMYSQQPVSLFIQHVVKF